MRYFYFIQDISVPAANALYELHQIIERARKNYAQSKLQQKSSKIIEIIDS
jgi:hypothetical protein